MAYPGIRLNDGNEIPGMALGTLKVADDDAAALVAEALAAGYRHVDTALAYGNERGVGEGVRASGLARDEVWVTTKLPPMVKERDLALRTVRESVGRLGLGYADLVLIHGPNPDPFSGPGDHCFEGNAQAWAALEDARDEGLARSIGVSNFEVVDLENVLAHGRVAPAVNQVRVHIGDVPAETLAWCAEHGVVVEAYSPFGSGRVFGCAEAVEVASRLGVSVQALAIQFCRQLGCVPVTKATRRAHMEANLAGGVAIPDADMEALLAVRLPDPGMA